MLERGDCEVQGALVFWAPMTTRLLIILAIALDQPFGCTFSKLPVRGRVSHSSW